MNEQELDYLEMDTEPTEVVAPVEMVAPFDTIEFSTIETTPRYVAPPQSDAATRFPPLPERPVNTAPKPVTIVWGFVIMALGVLAMTLASGTNVDLGLALVWLPAICGLALILAAILTALRRNKRNNLQL